MGTLDSPIKFHFLSPRQLDVSSSIKEDIHSNTVHIRFALPPLVTLTESWDLSNGCRARERRTLFFTKGDDMRLARSFALARLAHRVTIAQFAVYAKWDCFFLRTRA